MIQVAPRTRLAGSLLLVAAAACGSPEESSKTEIPPEPIRVHVARFEAAPRAIAAGESAVLAWATANATAIAISDDHGRPVPVEGLDVARGEVAVTPEATTSYTLTATGAPGTLGPAYRTVTLEVTPGSEDAPVIEAFEASAPEVPVGTPVTLSWRTASATSLTLRDDAGVAVDVGGQAVAQGSVAVLPARSPTRYTLTATGGGRTTSAQVTVDVLGLPRVHVFTAEPLAPVAPGSTIDLVWETSRAERIVLRDEDDAVLLDSTTALSDRLAVTLDRTKTFELTAIGPGGESSATTLARTGATIESFTASPRIARAGDPITLAWSVTDAEAVTLTGPGGFVEQASPAELAAGTRVALLPSSGDYVLAVRLGTVTQTWAIYVEVTEAPRVRSLVASETRVTAAADHPATVTLDFVQDGGTSCTLLRNGLVVPGFDHFACPRAGTLDVQLTGTADLRLIAHNHAGNHQAEVHLDAVDPARIPTFAVDPARRVAPGDSVTLSWTVTDAVLVRMERNGAPVAIGTTEFSGTRTDPVDFDVLYTLTAENTLGHLTTAQITVLAGAPVVADFHATPAIAIPGDAVTLSWVCDGGNTLTVTDEGDVEIANVTVPAQIDAGTVEVLAPATPGTHVYTLRVRNAANQETVDTAELVVTDGPLIRSLTASRAQISLGGTVNLTWQVTDDLAGVDPTLTLIDDFGNTYDVSGENPNADTVTVTPPEEGRHTFTLTATTPGTSASTRSVVVEVTVAPKIVSFTADPPVAYTEGGTVVPNVDLAWRTENGVELSIWELDADGQPLLPALHRLSLADGDSQAAIDLGTVVAGPTVTTRYLLRLVNRIGTTIESTVTVLVDPPRIVEFGFDPADLIAGETGTLSWTTENATSVMLQPMEPVVTAITNAFVDISGLTGAEAIPLTANDSYQLINFPPDFRFPFDGKLHAGMRVAMNGFISFDLASTGGSGTNQATFPTNATYNYVHLAPFWDVLQTYTTGSLYWRFDDAARTVTVMWKNWSYRSTSAPFDLNFEVVLYENGSFEYRYGTMFGGLTSSGTDYQYYADGAYSTVGYQNLTNSSGRLLHYGSSSTTGRFPGGFGNKGWFFDLATPINGSKPVAPGSSRTYTLTAVNSDLQITDTAQVKVWPVPVIHAASVYPSGPQANVPFTISWKNQHATRVRVLDSTGTVLCEKGDPADVLQGSCSLTVSSTGAQSLALEVINGLERNKVVRALNFVVFPRLQIEEFHASKTFIGPGESVTITWQGAGGFTATLSACVPKSVPRVCAPIDISGQDPNAGAYTTTVAQSTEFRFSLMDRLTRSEEASAFTWVDAPSIDSFTSTATQVASGSSVTLNWNTTGAASASVTGLPIPAPLEVTSTSPYADIAATGTPGTRTGTADSGYYVVNFPSGFKFPYFGVDQTVIKASIDGWVTFDTTYTSTLATNYSMPTSTTYQKVSLAPFWDSLVMKTTGQFYYELRTGPDGVRYMIFQWTGLEFSSSTYNPGNLNFQMVLFESGNFEYRYGTMTSSTSYPGYAAGQGATIGYQNYDVSFGQLIQTAYNTAVAGGVANRSWRFNLVPNADGQATVTPAESTTYRLCVTNASRYEACQEIRVVVVKPGDVMISELMVAPSTGDGEWFEVRNLGVDPINLAGFTIVSGTETVTVPSTPALLLAPKSLAVLARSDDPALNGGVSPLHVYGTGIDLGDSADHLQLMLGSVLIDKVTWAADWPIQPNRSIVLEPSAFAPAEAANDAKTSWCTASTAYAGPLFGNPGSIGSGCRSDGGYAYYLLDPYAASPFIDIAQTGTPIGGLWTAPFYSAPIPLGFSFPYFGDVATEMSVTKYGCLSLEALVGTLPTTNSEIPNATNAPNGMIAPMWDAQYDRGATSIAYELRPVNGQLVMVVQWTDIGPTSSSDYGTLTFQAQLWENGDIVLAYKNLVKSTSATYAAYQYLYGSGSTIGLENLAGDTAIQVFYGSSSTAGTPIYDGRAYRFIRK